MHGSKIARCARLAVAGARTYVAGGRTGRAGAGVLVAGARGRGLTQGHVSLYRSKFGRNFPFVKIDLFLVVPILNR
jgi:hypothetical protein